MWSALTLGCLIVTQHFLAALRARDLGGPSMLGATSVRAADPPSTTSSASPSIPNYRGKKLRQAFKNALVKASKCPIPRTQGANEICDWFACKYKQHKDKLEERKVKMQDVFVRQTPLAAWLTKSRNERTAEDYLLSSRKTRKIFYKVFYYAVVQYDGGCDPEQEELDDLLEWTKTVFPKRYECIEEVVAKHLETHETCAEGFTHAFKLDMFQKCKNKKFYAEDRLSPVGGGPGGQEGETKPGVDGAVVAAEAVVPDQSVGRGAEREDQVAKTTKPGWKPGVLGTAGIITGIAAPSISSWAFDGTFSAALLLLRLPVTEALIAHELITIAAIDATVAVFASGVVASLMLLGLGALGASIALLVCKYKPAKKRAGVRQRFSQQKKDNGDAAGSGK